MFREFRNAFEGFGFGFWTIGSCKGGLGSLVKFFESRPRVQGLLLGLSWVGTVIPMESLRLSLSSLTILDCWLL